VSINFNSMKFAKYQPWWDLVISGREMELVTGRLCWIVDVGGGWVWAKCGLGFAFVFYPHRYKTVGVTWGEGFYSFVRKPYSASTLDIFSPRMLPFFCSPVHFTFLPSIFLFSAFSFHSSPSFCLFTSWLIYHPGAPKETYRICQYSFALHYMISH
jgi:hypothetical protein